jgi:hypothetical protein
MRLTAFGGGNRFVAKSDTKIRRARWFHKNGSFPAGIVGDEAQARCSGAALGITPDLNSKLGFVCAST